MAAMKRLAMELADAGVDINDPEAVANAMWWVQIERDTDYIREQEELNLQHAAANNADQEEAMYEEMAAMEDERNFAGACAWDY